MTKIVEDAPVNNASSGAVAALDQNAVLPKKKNKKKLTDILRRNAAHDRKPVGKSIQ